MSIHDETYAELLQTVLNGAQKGDRTGTGTTSVFGTQHRYDLRKGFPLLTTKRIPFKAVAIELLWFLRGDTNIKYLQDNGVTIWDEWADDNGDLGPVYGTHWRGWDAHTFLIDQISCVIDQIKENPNSRRHIVTAWNPTSIDDAALPPCHILFQFYVVDGEVSCHLYQRSGDVFLGVPFNIASYALLTHMIAQVTGLKVGEFVHSIGDAHLYNNHMDQALEQLARDEHIHEAPTLVLNPDITDIDDFTWEDITLENYTHEPTIKAPVAV